MAAAFYSLKKGLKKGLSHVQCCYTCVSDNGTPTKYKYYTGIKIKADHWDKRNRRIKPTVTNAEELNRQLSQIASDINTVANELRTNGVAIRAEDLKTAHNRFRRKKADVIAEGNVIEMLEKYIQDLLDTEANMNTIRVKQTLQGLLTLYVEKKRGGTVLQFDDITLGFFRDFTTFLGTITPATTRAVKNTKWKTKAVNNIPELKRLTGERKTRISKATIAKYIGLLSFYLKNTGRCSNIDFSMIKKPKANFDIKRFERATLNESDLDKIAALIGSGTLSEELQIEAERLYVCCWLGLRVSDYPKLVKHSFSEENGVWIFRIVTKKTVEGEAKAVTSKVPVYPMAAAILQKRNFAFPVVAEQKINIRYKRVCELAGIDEILTNSHGETALKREDVSTHTCRRSFITNYLNRGFSCETIAKLTGQSVKMIAVYDKTKTDQAVDYVIETGWDNRKRIAPKLKAV